jgi:hypothetical protein
MSLFEEFLNEKKNGKSPFAIIYEKNNFDKFYEYKNSFPCRIYSIATSSRMNDYQLCICYLSENGIELKFVQVFRKFVSVVKNFEEYKKKYKTLIEMSKNETIIKRNEEMFYEIDGWKEAISWKRN